jgi:microcystin degradation protein MlrC
MADRTRMLRTMLWRSWTGLASAWIPDFSGLAHGFAKGAFFGVSLRFTGKVATFIPALIMRRFGIAIIKRAFWT